MRPCNGGAAGRLGPGRTEADRAGHERRRDRRRLPSAKTRKGDRMAVFTLEDAQGGVEVIAFPETYPAQRAA